jgi:hypothetical protein
LQPFDRETASSLLHFESAGKQACFLAFLRRECMFSGKSRLPIKVEMQE